MRSFLRSMQLQTKMILLICGVLALALFVAHFFVSRSIETQVRQSLLEKADSISKIISWAPTVMSLENPSVHSKIQSFTEQMTEDTNVEFIVVFDMVGSRISHPDSSKIGQHIVGGDELQVFNGQSYVSYAEGTLGPSLRAFRPVYNEKNEQIGGVVVGILLSDIDSAVDKSNWALLYSLSLALLFGIIAAVFLSRSIKGTLLGLEPRAIARVTEERNAVLQSVREGILVINNDGILTVVNQEAQRILANAGINEDLLGKPIKDYIPNTRLLKIIYNGNAEFNQEQDLNGVTVLVNRVPLKIDGEIIGAMATFRDLTDINRYVEALRAQAHEFLNKLHVIYGLINNKKYDDLSKYIATIVQKNQTELDFIDQRIKEPIISAFLQSKLSRSRELGINLFINPQTHLPLAPDQDFSLGVITILGNLIDNAMDAVQSTSQQNIEIFLKSSPSHWYFEVRDTGLGVDNETISHLFTRGFSTKGKERGLGLFLVTKVLDKYNGHIEVVHQEPQGLILKVTLLLPKGDNLE